MDNGAPQLIINNHLDDGEVDYYHDLHIISQIEAINLLKSKSITSSKLYITNNQVTILNHVS